MSQTGSFTSYAVSNSKDYLSLEDQALFSTWVEWLESFQHHQATSSRFLEIFDSIPITTHRTYLHLACFSFLLDKYDAPRFAFDILRCYTKLWRTLPEAAKAGVDHEASAFVKQVQQQVNKSVGPLASLFPVKDTVALTNTDGKKSLTHRHLSTFVQNFHVPLNIEGTNSRKLVIILALPNGYLLGLACLAVATYHTAVPINTSGGPKQFKSDAMVANPQAIMVLESDIGNLGLHEPWVAAANIEILVVEQNWQSTFSVRTLHKSASPSFQRQHSVNSAEDFALILLTSGTSGTKKLVPVTTSSLMIGICCVIDSWGLSTEDTCLNMMPLNHVGGIVRNLFAPVLSGGATILCPAFDPNVFWDFIENGSATWYYASPSMHTSILIESAFRLEAIQRSRLRLICNAAGGLLPALAQRLQNTFGCTVLPSYGMTECMPISTPPLGYTLDRSGTSGVSCGPEIMIMSDDGQPLGTDEIGRICVRGGPTFGGYLQPQKSNIVRNAFFQGGWFDTGDLGYLDSHDYLFLTGRGKEVINRGGELISPFEIEEAITIASHASDSPLYNRVREALAFSAPHETLQEVVGVALVIHPEQTRPDLRELQEALKPTLHSSKWPVLVVYMNALPTNNNKIVRIQLGERLGLEPIRDDTRLVDRHFEAVCPPPNSTLETKIPKSSCSRDSQVILKKVEEYLGPDFEAYVSLQPHDGLSEVFVAPHTTSTPKLSVLDLRNSLYDILRRDLNGYLIPSKITYIQTPFPKKDTGIIDERKLGRLFKDKALESTLVTSETEQKIRQVIAEVLQYPADEISSETDFFEIGGDSLSAGRLLSILRRDLQIRVPVDQLFTSSKVKDLSLLAEKLLASQVEITDGKLLSNNSLIGSGRTYSSTNPILLIIQLLPIAFFYPLRMALQWVMLIYALGILATYWKDSHVATRFLSLITSMAISRASAQIAGPIFSILFKWIVIGRYKEGLYPMWGFYHTRWWIVQKVLLLYGDGVFGYTDYTRLLFYRLLGAKIGNNVTINPETVLGEYDLLQIGDNVHLDGCICRPFACERNSTMYLGGIVIGKNSSVGLKSHIAAGSTLPDDTFIGPNSSSYEMDPPKDDSHGLGRRMVPKAHIVLRILVIFPTQILVLFVSSLPWMAGIFGVVKGKPTVMNDSVKTIITWWASPGRIAFHYVAVVLHVGIGPLIWFVAIVVVKAIFDKVIGKARACSKNQRSQKDNFRRSLMDALVPRGDLGNVTKLFGTHYEFTSMAVRAMGGNVGRNIYWPGTSLNFQDFDLVNIGNDVVFGSRSYVVTSDSLGSSPVEIQDGAMIADRVILSAGTTVGKNTVLGSGTLAKRNQTYASNTVWIGNKNGGPVCLTKRSNEKSTTDNTSGGPQGSGIGTPMSFSSSASPKDSCSTTKIAVVDAKKPESVSTPFGRAFYHHQAPYFVFNQKLIFIYSTSLFIFVKIFWDIGPLLTVVVSTIIKHSDFFSPTLQRPFIIYGFAVAICSITTTLLCFISLLALIAAKWALLGRRRPGSYDWDKNSYCQRWQLFLTIEALRRRCLGGVGVLEMLTGTHYAVLYFRAMGAKIGKDCALFAGGRPSLIFTEPDLLDLGDRVAVDDASLVSHINSRGNFALNRLSVGSRSVLRSGSRLLSGAQMGEDACLLEHTIIMAGDIADDRMTYQGWPADVFYSDRLEVGPKEAK